MTRKRVVVSGAIAIVLLVIFVGVVLGFFNRLVDGDVAHPPCGQLPDRADVEQAIAEHTRLVEQLTAAGAGVDVIVGTPCSDPDQALVAIRVATAEEEASVRDILGSSNGFGVPAVVERR